MKSFALVALALAASPFASFAQKQEIRELQRDVGLLQDQMKQFQRSQDEKMAALTVLVQQALEAANKVSTSVAVLERTLNDKLSDQSKNLVGPVASVGSKVDQMAEEFRGVRESISDLNARLGRLETKIVDLGNAMRTINAPPPAPTSGSLSGGSAPASPPAGVSAEVLYQNAYRDYTGGKYDLAQQEFTEFLKYFDNTELAPNAQFYIGECLNRAGRYDEAVKAYDTVLEKYPENNKSADARFMKGKSLVAAGQPTAGAEEFRALMKRYPNHELAHKAQAELRKLGLAAPRSANPGRRKKDL